ncbi:unnamed protein product [Urochloa humidicola]
MEVSASTGVMNSLLSKLSTLLSDQYKQLKGVRKDIEFLSRERIWRSWMSEQECGGTRFVRWPMILRIALMSSCTTLASGGRLFGGDHRTWSKMVNAKEKDAKGFRQVRTTRIV